MLKIGLHTSSAMDAVAVTSTYSKRITCAAYTFGLGPRAAGSAALSPAGVLLIEWPRPWPSHIENIPELQPIRDAAKKSQIKILLIHQHRGLIPEEPHSVILYQPRSQAIDGDEGHPHTPRPWFGIDRYCKRDDIVETACQLLADADAGRTTENTAQSSTSPTIIDLLVCTHGARDRCCGRDGSRLAVELTSQHTDPNIRVWHASHLGGHRFAPTATLLPHGTSWAYLDADTILGIADQSLDAAKALAHFRGSVMWPHHAPQSVDVDGFAKFGWDWLESSRVATQIDEHTWSVHELNGDRFVTSSVETRPYEVPPCGTMAGTPYEPDEFLEYVTMPEGGTVQVTLS